jgi:hypothetical protein
VKIEKAENVIRASSTRFICHKSARRNAPQFHNPYDAAQQRVDTAY